MPDLKRYFAHGAHGLCSVRGETHFEIFNGQDDVVGKG